MELLIHIYQSIDYLKELVITPDMYEDKQIDVKISKPGMKKVLLLDLDETLVHCVKNPQNYQHAPHVQIPLTTPSGMKI